MSDSNRANDDKNTTAANAPPLHSTVIQCNVHRANMHCTSISFHRAIVFACLAVVAFVSISFSQLILGLRIFFMFYWQAKTHNAFLLSFFDVCIFVFHSLSQYCCCFLFVCLRLNETTFIKWSIVPFPWNGDLTLLLFPMLLYESLSLAIFFAFCQNDLDVVSLDRDYNTYLS